MHNWPHLYAESLADVSDVADEIGKASRAASTTSSQRGEKRARQEAQGCRGRALGILLCYRKSWFNEIGVRQISGELGTVSPSGQAAQGEGPADRPDARPHL